MNIRQWSMRRKILTGIAIAFVAFTVIEFISNVVINSTPEPLASQIAPGSMAVPCFQIAGQIRAVLPYYTGLGPADDSPLYGLETALANKFGNVSNLDSPVSLSSSEVAFEVDVLNGGYITPNMPYASAIGDDINALAAACGIQQ